MGLYGCGVWLTSHWTTPRRHVYRAKLDAWKNLTRALERDFDVKMRRPVSGQYCGDSVESDKGDQDVVTHLRFLSDGSVRGDGVDGWVKRSGDIFIRFCSSRGITGSVDLELLEA